MATGNVSFTPAGGVSGAVTTVTSVLKTDLVIGEDAQTAVDFETANEIHFDADNAERVSITATGLTMSSGSILLNAAVADASGTASLGTDLKIYFTCNNGTNWTEATSYRTATTYSGTKKLVTLGATTCTAGTQVAMKAVWANQASGSKETLLEGWAVNY